MKRKTLHIPHVLIQNGAKLGLGYREVLVAIQRWGSQIGIDMGSQLWNEYQKGSSIGMSGVAYRKALATLEAKGLSTKEEMTNALISLGARPMSNIVGPFVGVPLKFFRAKDFVSVFTPGELMTMLFIASAQNMKSVHVSQKSIATALGIGHRQAINFTTSLQKRGYLVIEKKKVHQYFDVQYRLQWEPRIAPKKRMSAIQYALRIKVLKQAIFGFEEAFYGIPQFAAVAWALNHSEPEYQSVHRPDDGRTSLEIIRDSLPTEKSIAKFQTQVMEAERLSKMRVNESILAKMKKMPD